MLRCIRPAGVMTAGLSDRGLAGGAADPRPSTRLPSLTRPPWPRIRGGGPKPALVMPNGASRWVCTADSYGSAAMRSIAAPATV